MTRPVFFALLACLTACGRGTPADPLPRIPFEKYTLANGLDVILAEDHRLPLVAVDVWYHVGPANEAAGRTGFAHLFEHMMFQGSKHVPGDSHFKLLEAAGGTGLNGTTDFDRTNYFETLPANQIELGLWLEADRMGYLLDTVDEAKLANQQDVVRNERRQSVEGQPYGIVQEALFRTVFPAGHPYRASVIGSHADIQAAKLGDVKTFFKQYYTPNNASLAIAGDFDAARAKALVEKYFGPLNRGPSPPKLPVETPAITAERRLVVPDRVQLQRVYMAWLTPPFMKPGDAEADAAAAALGGGPSSRLYKSLVYEKQLAQDVTAAQYSLGLRSVFLIMATARPGKSAADLETAIDEELRKFRDQGPDAREVERAKNAFETRVLSDLELLGGFGGVADMLNLFNHYTGDPGYLPRYLDEHRKLTPEGIKAFAQQHLQRHTRVVVHGIPGQPDLGQPVPTLPAPKVAAGTGAESVNADVPWRKDQPAAAAARPITLPTPTSLRLPNGLTVLLHERPSGMPVVSAQLVVRTGGDANPIERPGLAGFTAALLDQGTASRSAAQVAEDAARLGASLDASSSKDATVVSVGALKKHFPAALELVADVALRPSFPQAEVDRQRTSRLTAIVAQSQDPTAIASTAAVAALYGHKHPYGYMELGTDVGLNATSRDDLVGFWKRGFAPANAALVVAGPITMKELEPLVKKMFGSWSGAAAVPAALGAPETTAARVVVVDEPGSPQTQVVIATIGPPRATPDFAAVNVLNNALGGLFSSRINMNLREAHGYTYGASSSFIFRKGAGPFWIRSAVRTEVTAPAVAEILKEVGRVLADPISADELASARDAIVRALPGEFETSGGTAAVLSSLFTYDLGTDFYSKYPGLLAAVTADHVRAAAQKHLAPERMVIVVVGDRAKIEAGLRKLNLGTIEYRDSRGFALSTGGAVGTAGKRTAGRPRKRTDMDKAIATQLANIEKRTGKSLEALAKVITASGRPNTVKSATC